MLSGRWRERAFSSLQKMVSVAGSAAAASLPRAATASPADLLPGSELDPRSLLVIGIVAGLILFSLVAAISFLRATRRARNVEAAAEANAARLDGELDVIQSMLVAEPQVLVRARAHLDDRGHEVFGLFEIQHAGRVVRRYCRALPRRRQGETQERKHACTKEAAAQ